MVETEVRCTCTDWTVSVGCPVHGCPRQPILSVNLPEGTLVTLPGEAMQQVVRDGPDGMLMLHPAGQLGEKAVNVVRRMLTRWLQRPELRDVIMEVVKEDVKRRGPGPMVIKAPETYEGWVAEAYVKCDERGKMGWDPCDLAGFVKAFWPIKITPWQMRAIEEFDRMSVAHRENPPLIVRATPEQRAALAEAREQPVICTATNPAEQHLADVVGAMLSANVEQMQKHLVDAVVYGKGVAMTGVDLASGPDQSMRCVARHLPDGSMIIDEITPVLPDEVWGAVKQVSAAEAQAEYNRRQTRLVEMAIAAGNTPEAVASAVIGTFRTPPAQSAPPLGRMATQRLDPAAPVAACTAHVTAAPAMPELTCGACGWQGGATELIQDQGATDPSEVVCPSCGCDATRDGSVYPTEPADMMGRAALPASSPLDQAIRGSASLDPGGDRKPAEQLLVETFDQAEARRKVDAARIAKIMKGGGL